MQRNGYGSKRLTHLRQLEAESIHIIREVAAEFANPVMLYSIGKDSSVMLHLARKAFYPGTLPFPLLHVDTGWKFREMYAFRDRTANAYGCELLVHKNPEGVAMGINPFVHGSAKHTDIMKTEGLKQALNKYGFDAAFGGARRDEEKSRAKERIYSFRDRFHRWDPKNQRPELWRNYNGQINKGESIRVFPLSNWTEQDIWQYIWLENIDIVPLYLAAERPVLERDGMLMMVDDDRIDLQPGEVIKKDGALPYTWLLAAHRGGGIPRANAAGNYRRDAGFYHQRAPGRMIDRDQAGSMELKNVRGISKEPP
ncbi:sulfate adenylyltransferase subunit CysD [Salmonella sp. WGH-01]|nr:sulfate adenylyltransferase subunit CysD [Salmonella sp. WGH-01]